MTDFMLEIGAGGQVLLLLLSIALYIAVIVFEAKWGENDDR